ncbi:hypothetical protein [Rufibacter latericius]|uniref:hypothetical protein n=1 Tax=Rufibacter latericius TaxID=2487040 RepID=UPI0014031365|nr:hypothetical protein [Rufibacter latericius]
MKRYLPLLGVFLLFFLVISGFAHGQAKIGKSVLSSSVAGNGTLVSIFADAGLNVR